uniref:ATP-binding cassette, sub-family B (MDR/TAP), member 9 n=1 Tax=Callorhinchus milii TaxID=7868 RepID=A0A4W3IZ02_CALMI
MRGWQAGVCSLLGAALDVSVTTVLYIHGTEYQRFSADLRRFSMSRSFLDLWAACVLRLCLLSGAGLGVCLNPAQGPGRLGRWAGWLRLLFGLVPLYATVKLLLYSDTSAFPHDPWFWSLLAWTYFCSLATGALCHLLSCCNLLTDEPEEERRPEKPGAGRRLISLCWKEARLLTAGAVFLLLAELGMYPCLSHCYLYYNTVIIILAFDITALSSGVRGGIFTLVFARINIRIRNMLFRSLLQQDIAFFDANHTGDITSRLTSDTTVVSDMLSHNGSLFLQSVVRGLGVCVFMVVLSWQLSLVTFMGFPIMILSSEIYGKYCKNLAAQVQDVLAKANNLAEETISSMKTVRSFGTEETECREYCRRMQDVYTLNRKEAMAFSFFTCSGRLVQISVQICILYYGGFLVIAKHMTPGNLISFIIYELQLGDCLENLGTVYTGLMQGTGAAEKIFQYMDQESCGTLNEGTLAPDMLKGEITFSNVSFAYPTRPHTQVLKDVCFTLSPGEVTALVGPSGSGKSSCVHLMEHFYSPQAGEVLLDGLPLPKYQSQYLHSQVTLVGQEPVLFARPIHENIAYGLADCPVDMMVWAAKTANAHGFITELTDGYGTETGEKGAQLSGGQKQRVAIARALVRSPRILLLDEATSALDAESDHKIQQALCSIKENCTVLIVAHRLSTVKNADKIIVLQDGTVVEEGKHEELMRREGLYARLVHRQLLDIKSGGKRPLAEHLHRIASERAARSSGASEDLGIGID